MLNNFVGAANEAYLRIVFDDAVISLPLRANATYGEIAHKIQEVSAARNGALDIGVTFGPHFQFPKAQEWLAA